MSTFHSVLCVEISHLSLTRSGKDGVEFVAHAHAMREDTALQKAWLEKNTGKAAQEAFKNAFERHKKTGLFNGLAGLHKTRASCLRLVRMQIPARSLDRFVSVTKEQNIESRLKFTGAEPKLWVLMPFRCSTCSTMENTLFGDYDGRLKLDTQLMRMSCQLGS
jgi:hypothetical protein